MNHRDVPVREMPRYKCHKVVYALKIKGITMHNADNPKAETDGSAMLEPAEDGYAAFRVDLQYMHKHKPQVGGYYVVYEDGYKSYSPAEAFEAGYTEISQTERNEEYGAELALMREWARGRCECCGNERYSRGCGDCEHNPLCLSGINKWTPAWAKWE